MSACRYIHVGNLWYGFSNAITTWSIYQCMVVKEKVRYGKVATFIASMAFCSGAIGHISQYLGFPFGSDQMNMEMRIFVYCQGMITSFMPVNWICYNRCQQPQVAYGAKVALVILCIIQTMLFTVHESGFVPWISIGPPDMALMATQGWWHAMHSVMHIGYAAAAVLCYATMPSPKGKEK